ncbi:hypothetical protein EJ05DRAFT_485729 [Pseudovirgaria hyperparasitica]|uniref:histidine kinase n=1 Tax=Pseudovirgaria hyperparasitica TaxID=470096 RepID=A0A6A6W9S1_9PEZI|nr:uncharacterized protein EJ05DRAFT_485729 [Pseudovirgaria hyperparasitica]KAF2758626.1 hypothetical protein EJ05DRAFT_485729 [Pseudovirgaria hyperparasitica]
MRIPIREQLGLLVILAALIALAVVASATWITTRNFVLELRATRLSLTASLKAAQLTSNLALMQSQVRSAASRLVIQSALQRYNNGNNTVENWTRTRDDLAAVFQGGGQSGLLLQARIFAKNSTGPAGSNTTLVEATGVDVVDTVQLPGLNADGSSIYLGSNGSSGYPSNLYPNLTYRNDGENANTGEFVTVDGTPMDSTDTLLLGPWQLNETVSLLSITLPIINNTSASDMLGWLTVVLDGRLIGDVVAAREGLGDSGVTLLIGPNTQTNRFPSGILSDSNNGNPPDNVEVVYKLAPTRRQDVGARHTARDYGSSRMPFSLDSFPAAKIGFTSNLTTLDNANNAGSAISTRNEEGLKVSVGYATPSTSLVDWLLVVEQSRAEVWEPINRLRTVLLACIFATLGAMLLFAVPAAHYASRPIRRLRDATKQTVTPPGYGPSSPASSPSFLDDDVSPGHVAKEGFFAAWKRFSIRRDADTDGQQDEGRRTFRIPGKVKDRKHYINDELTDLTRTYNEMSDELMMQYERLEERVAQRTAELELSKKAAEAANESKTLFIANISHELKTPLNGIMGMCAVCMSEEDPIKLKRSLGIIYKSGDLLLNLLTDLLTFSKNQVGQQLALDEKEFRLRDISTQVLAIFERQAKENHIDLSINLEGPLEANTDHTGIVNEKLSYGPFGLGKVKDMVLYGDQHRILQVLINLVSNSLKFTPKHGKVIATIRCVGESNIPISRHESVHSRLRSAKSKVPSSANSSTGTSRLVNTATANEINALQKPSVYAQILASELNAPPPAGRVLEFQFEVTDTGPGIPEHLHQRIFEPFVQGDLGLSKKHGGTGLGLSICSQLAGLMRGHVDVSSTLGQGSKFTMTIPLRHLTSGADSTSGSSIVSFVPPRTRSLDRGPDTSTDNDDASSMRSFASAPSPSNGPVAFDTDTQPRLVGLSQPFFASNVPLESPDSQPAAMERVKAEASHRMAKVKVLVAEDNKTNQEVVLRMLKLEEIYDVTVAKDGQEALDRVKESMEDHKPYSLIFMDVQMPNLDGLESTRLIRKTGYTAPIVALTAYSEESNVKECIASGMDYFLSKPIRRPQLKQVLKTYCPTIQEEDEERSMSSSSAKVDSPAEERGRGSSSPPKPVLGSVDFGATNSTNTRDGPITHPSREPSPKAS